MIAIGTTSSTHAGINTIAVASPSCSLGCCPPLSSCSLSSSDTSSTHPRRCQSRRAHQDGDTSLQFANRYASNTPLFMSARTSSHGSTLPSRNRPPRLQNAFRVVFTVTKSTVCCLQCAGLGRAVGRSVSRQCSTSRPTCIRPYHHVSDRRLNSDQHPTVPRLWY
jgi:hypothetical protein